MICACTESCVWLDYQSPPVEKTQSCGGFFVFFFLLCWWCRLHFLLIWLITAPLSHHWWSLAPVHQSDCELGSVPSIQKELKAVVKTLSTVWGFFLFFVLTEIVLNNNSVLVFFFIGAVSLLQTAALWPPLLFSASAESVQKVTVKNNHRLQICLIPQNAGTFSHWLRVWTILI